MKAGPLQMHGEIWRKVTMTPFFEKTHLLEASSYGRIRKTNLKTQETNIITGSGINGYLIIRLKGKNSVGKLVYWQQLVHRVVAVAFLPAPGEDKPFIIHLDHNKHNNAIKNLAWASQKQVADHNKSNPLVINRVCDKTKHPCTKLRPTQVALIKKRLKEGATLRNLARNFKVSDMQISRIKQGENWADIK